MAEERDFRAICHAHNLYSSKTFSNVYKSTVPSVELLVMSSNPPFTSRQTVFHTRDPPDKRRMSVEDMLKAAYDLGKAGKIRDVASDSQSLNRYKRVLKGYRQSNEDGCAALIEARRSQSDLSRFLAKSRSFFNTRVGQYVSWEKLSKEPKFSSGHFLGAYLVTRSRPATR